MSFAVYFVASMIAKARMSSRERDAIESLETIERLLKQHDSTLNEADKQLLWSELMTYVATAHSEYFVRKCVDRAGDRLLDYSTNLKSRSLEIIDYRKSHGEL